MCVVCTEAEWLLDNGALPWEAAKRLDMSRRSLHQHLLRHGLERLAERVGDVRG